MFKDEFVTVFEHRTRVDTEPNPDFDKEAGVSAFNCPNRGVEKVEWIAGVDGSDNLAITQQSSHKTEKAAYQAAVKLARENERNYYVLIGEYNSWKRISV